MHRSTVRVVLLLAMLSITASLLPVSALADEGTPVASPETLAVAPPVGAPIASTSDACDPTAFPAGATGVAYQPLTNLGFVTPADANEHTLYLTVETLTPGSCLLFDRGTFGATTFFVLEGTVEFIAWGGRTAIDPVVTAGTADEEQEPVNVPSGAPVTLAAGDWVTVDRAAEAYAYRNPGGGDGQIIMAALEPLGPRNGCQRACRRNP